MAFKKTPEQTKKEQITEGTPLMEAVAGKATEGTPVEAPTGTDFLESDEIPLPPFVAGSMPGRDGMPEAGTEVPTGEIPEDLFNSILESTGREPMPARVFHFRLDSFKGLKKGPKAHYYETIWRCQDEPYTGRPVYHNIMWVSEDTLKAAIAGDQEALKNCQNHMKEGKLIMKKAKWPGRDMQQFLTSHPELNLRLRIKEKMSKVGYDKDGNPIYEPSREFGNEVAEFLPLT